MMVSHINDTRGDTVVGSQYADTIYAGSNDYVDGGAGNDVISLYSTNGSNGASVVLSNGMNSVVGWQQGFDNSEGALPEGSVVSVRWLSKKDGKDF